MCAPNELCANACRDVDAAVEALSEEELNFTLGLSKRQRGILEFLVEIGFVVLKNEHYGPTKALLTHENPKLKKALRTSSRPS